MRQTECETDAEDERLVVYLGLLLRQLHVVKDPEDNSEQVLPPVFLKGVPVGLHHFKHHCQPPGKCAHTQTHTHRFALSLVRLLTFAFLQHAVHFYLADTCRAAALYRTWTCLYCC